jgi:hypothetical protein
MLDSLELQKKLEQLQPGNQPQDPACQGPVANNTAAI